MITAQRGFTLIELTVAMAIIGILAAVVVIGAQPASERSRDTTRQSDLRQVQTALELYKTKYGRYPERCPSPDSDWSGQPGSSYRCNDSRDPYILGNTLEGRPFAEFMVNLPTDPKLNGSNSGYVYTTNSDGSVYKFMVRNTVESETVTDTHPFRSCAAECAASITHCQATNSQFQTSYAVWGGYDAPSINSTPTQVQAATEDVICEIS